MTKYELKEEDKAVIINHIASSHLYKLIKEYDTWNFEIGDVLVRYSLAADGGKSIEYVGSSCQVPKKYKVLYIDDAGIPWTKQVSVRGGLGKKIRPLVNLADGYRYTMEVDPEQIDAIILGYKYDPRIEYKRMRDRDPEYGRKD